MVCDTIIAHSAVQSSTRTLFAMLFCFQTPYNALYNKPFSLIEKPYLAILASNATGLSAVVSKMLIVSFMIINFFIAPLLVPC